MSLKNPELSIERVAEGAIADGIILKQGTAGLQVAPAAAATDKLIGVSEHAADDGTGVRLQVGGRAKLKAGGTIAAGDLLTSDASGQAVAAAPATGVNNRIIGYALDAAVSGDFFSGMIFPGSVQGA